MVVLYSKTTLTPFRLIIGDEVQTQVEMKLCEPQPTPVVKDDSQIAGVLEDDANNTTPLVEEEEVSKAPKVIILRNLLQQRQERMLEEQQLALDNIRMN